MLKQELLQSNPNCFEHMIVQTNEDMVFMEDGFLLLFFLKGRTNVRYWDRTRPVRETDIIFFSANTPFFLECQGEYVSYYRILVSDSYLREFAPSLSDVRFDHFHITRRDDRALYDTICNYLASTLFLSISDEAGRSFRQLTDINRIILCLQKEFASPPAEDPSPSSQSGLRVRQILSLIEEHYREKYRLEDLSADMGFHPQYVSSFFRKYFHEKYTDFLNRYRTGRSIRDLLYTDRPLLEIALNHGFMSNKSYSNSFQKYYGMLPSSYRQLHSLHTKEAASFQEEATLVQKAEYLYNYYWKKNAPSDETIFAHPEPDEEAIPLSLEISVPGAQVQKRDDRIKMIHIGSITYLLQDDVYEQLKLVKKTCSFTHVSVRDIFSDYLKVYSEPSPGHPIFFWGDLDRAIERILSLDMIPFLQIGYMPSALASAKSNLEFFNRPYMSQPNSLDRWKELITRFLNQCLRIFKGSVYSWRFDFWTTANMNMKNGYWNGTQDEFFDFYKATWEAFQAVDKRLMLGTPNFSLPDGIDWYRDFFRFCRKEKIRPAHLSLHLYSCADDLAHFNGLFPYAPTTYNYLALTTKNLISQILISLKQLAEKHGFRSLPIFATEWNITYVLSDLIRDTAFMAPYIVHTWLQTIGQMEGTGYFCLSDINDQFRPSDMLFSGEMGILSWQGIPKPAYHAFCLLHKLDPDVIAQSDCYIVTRFKQGFHILIYNMTDYEKYPDRELMGYTSHDHRYQVFSKAAPIRFHGIFHVHTGDYSIRVWRFDRTHGSFYDAWLSMGKPQVLDAEALGFLKHKSLPDLYIEHQEHTSTILLDETIAAHGITLFEIRKA